MALLLDSPAADTVRERFETAREQLATTARRGRRLAAQARHAVEDGAGAVSLGVRRRPLTSVAGAALIGALAGAAIVMLTGRHSNRRRWF